MAATESIHMYKYRTTLVHGTGTSTAGMGFGVGFNLSRPHVQVSGLRIHVRHVAEESYAYYPTLVSLSLFSEKEI